LEHGLQCLTISLPTDREFLQRLFYQLLLHVCFSLTLCFYLSACNIEMLCLLMQLQAILSDETAVEQAKKQGSFRANLSKRALLSEVFGKGGLS